MKEVSGYLNNSPSFSNIVLRFDEQLLVMTEKRIEVNPEILAGKPVVKGTRIPVYIVLEMFEDGADIKEILEAYPDLEKEDVKACLRYATKRMQREGLSEESVA